MANRSWWSIGNGMAGARAVEEVLARGGAEQFDITMFGDEPYGNYNRILLSNVLSGAQDPTRSSSTRSTGTRRTTSPCTPARAVDRDRPRRARWSSRTTGVASPTTSC